MDEVRPGDRVQVDFDDGLSWEGTVEVVGPCPWPELEDGELIVLWELPPTLVHDDSVRTSLHRLETTLGRRATPGTVPVKVDRSKVRLLRDSRGLSAD